MAPRFLNVPGTIFMVCRRLAGWATRSPGPLAPRRPGAPTICASWRAFRGALEDARMEVCVFLDKGTARMIGRRRAKANNARVWRQRVIESNIICAFVSFAVDTNSRVREGTKLDPEIVGCP